jgi:hypothetical protein
MLAVAPQSWRAIRTQDFHVLPFAYASLSRNGSLNQLTWFEARL